MSKYGETIAGEEDVIENAVKILKETHNIELTYEEMEEVYNITSSYIKKKLYEEDIGSVLLTGLGTAYYPITYINSQARTYKSKLKGKTGNKEVQKKQFEKWSSLKKKVSDHYQNFQSGINAKKNYIFWHVIQPMLISAKRRGFEMSDIEKIQNNIK